MSTLARCLWAGRRAPWWAWTLLVALAARLLFLFAADEPLLYSHPYNYFHGAMSILEHPDPVRFVLGSDNWHRWLGPWTIAPLYYVFLAALMALFGPHLLPIQLVQVGLDALNAVLTGLLGRRVAGPRGAWAGVAYAVNFHAVEQSAVTLTENLHTVLLLAGAVILVEEASRDGAARGRAGRALAGGALLGLSALARAVSTAFVPLVCLWRWWVGRDRAAFRTAAALGAGAALAVIPWTVRNAFVTGDFIPVETNGIYNFYDDNTFVEGARRRRQEALIGAQPTLAAQRDLAMRFALRGIARHPEMFVEKAWRNLLHFVRPDGLQVWLVVEEPMPLWRRLALVVFDDLVVLPAVVLFTVYLLAGRRTPAWGMIAAWTAYYLLMVVVLFHNEIRYRSTLLPFALAGAAGGVALLAHRQGGRVRVGLALALSGGLVALVVAPYVAPLGRAARAWPALRAMEAAVARGDAAEARRQAERAAAADPAAARPWLRYGRALGRQGRAAEALDAYDRAAARKAHVWTPLVVRPALLRAAGREPEAERALAEAKAFSWSVDPWLALEAAWRHLPPPLTDEVQLGGFDYGAARGFTNPHPGHRWTRHRAWLRLRPATPAPSYEVTLWMSSPEPSPQPSPEVTVRAGGVSGRFTLTRDVQPYRLTVPAPPDGTLRVRIDAPTWNRGREHAEQGVAVSRLAVARAP